ncbi:hypothetical protein HA402_002443 [Bradysia odoriphaga]|nr:hypothetical protein HA402_002443 [Bradysia odoriphaga]
MLRGKMKPYKPSSKVTVRESLDDDFSDDVEDDVFIRDGKMSKSYEENGLKRPLMAPRRKKQKVSSPVAAIMKKKVKCWRCCEPFCYGFIALAILIAIIFLAAILLTMFPVPLQKVKLWLRKDGQLQVPSDLNDYALFNGELVPCTQISVQKTWSKAFSKLSSESPVRKCDVNQDGVEDIIIGYGIDDNFQYDDTSIPKCDDSTSGYCEGGILAIDGINGNTIWQKWTAFNVFSLYCSEDLNDDMLNDCVASGRGGLVIGVNGRNGNVLWQLKDDTEDSTVAIINLYTVNSIRDLNGDNIADVLAVHVEERRTSRAGHIKLISGKDGKVIRSIPTPFNEEVFVPIQIITQFDGTECLLIVTGGQNSAGGLYLIRIHELMMNERKRNEMFEIIEEIFYATGDKDVILGEIGMIKSCIANGIPYNRIDIDINTWRKKFLAGEDKITFDEDEVELNEQILSLRMKADEVQEKIDIMTGKLKDLMEFPSFLKVMEFLKRMNGHVRSMMGKCDTRTVANKMNHFEVAGMLQYGWKCFVQENKQFVFKTSSEDLNEDFHDDREDDLFLSVDVAANEPFSTMKATNESLLDEDKDNGSFLDEQTGQLNGNTDNGSFLDEETDELSFVEKAVTETGMVLDEKTGLLFNEMIGTKSSDETIEAFLDETTGTFVTGKRDGLTPVVNLPVVNLP